MEEEMIFAMKITDISEFYFRHNITKLIRLPYITNIKKLHNGYIISYKRDERQFAWKTYEIEIGFWNDFKIIQYYEYKAVDVTEYFIDALKEIYYRYFYGNEVYDEMDTLRISPWAEVIRAL